MHLNSVVVMGNVVRDPEIRFAGASQTPVTEVRVAINRNWKDAQGKKRQEVCFIDCTCWSRTAEIAVQFLKKGRLAAFEGRLTQDEWTSPDGKKNSRIHVTVDRLTLMPGNPNQPTEAEEETTPDVEPVTVPVQVAIVPAEKKSKKSVATPV